MCQCFIYFVRKEEDQTTVVCFDNYSETSHVRSKAKSIDRRFRLETGFNQTLFDKVSIGNPVSGWWETKKKKEEKRKKENEGEHADDRARISIFKFMKYSNTLHIPVTWYMSC